MLAGVLWLVVVGGYVVVLRSRHVESERIRANLGLRFTQWRWYAAGACIGVLTLAIGALIVSFGGFSDLIRSPYYAQTHYASWSLGVLTVLLAFVREFLFAAGGEELFFRGLIMGVLARRMRFQLANALQTLIFLLPHLAILPLAGARYWPLLIPVIVGGWLLGWLRLASGSILPGMIIHTAVNTVAAAAVMTR